MLSRQSFKTLPAASTAAGTCTSTGMGTHAAATTTTTTLQRRVNARKREGDFIGIFGVFVTSGAECIGAVGIPGVGKCAHTDRAPTCILRGLRGTKRSFA